MENHTYRVVYDNDGLYLDDGLNDRFNHDHRFHHRDGLEHDRFNDDRLYVYDGCN